MKRKKSSNGGSMAAAIVVGMCYFPLGVIFKLAKSR